MDKKGKLVSSILSLLFVITGLYIYYLINSIPEYYYIQLSEKRIIFMLYSLLIIGSMAITFNFLYFQSNQQLVFIEKTESVKDIRVKEADNINQSDTTDLISISEEVKKIINTDSPINKKTDKILSLICNKLEACQGIIYRLSSNDSQPSLSPFSTYAFVAPENKTIEYQLGEGLVGVSAKEDRRLLIKDIPEGYVKIVSGLGKSYPTLIAIYPLKHKNNVTGILELALFSRLNNNSARLLDEILSDLGLLVA